MARSCAKEDPGQWNAVLETMPCVRALIADVVAASLEPENAHVKQITFDIRPPGSSQATETGQAFQRTTPARNARLERRMIIAGLNSDRDTQHRKADESSASSSQGRSDTRPEADLQNTFTRDVKHASPSYKREVTGPGGRPKWQPTTCTAPGVTCGTTGHGGPVSRNKMRSDLRCDTKSPSLRLALRDAHGPPKRSQWFQMLCISFGIFCEDAVTPNDGSENADTGQATDLPIKREAQPSPKVPKWFPQSCTARGITCARLGTSDKVQNNRRANQPVDSTAKREVRPVPMAAALPVPQQKPPKWKPTTCTVPSMTCGSITGVASGATDDNTGADGAPSTTEQSGTGKRIKKRGLDAAEQVWSGAGKSIFIDDEGNVIQIEEESAFAA